MKLLYIVNRQPRLSETFISDEIEGIRTGYPDIHLRLFSLAEEPLAMNSSSLRRWLSFSWSRESAMFPLRLERLTQIIKTERPDLIHCQYASAPASIGLWLSEHYDIPFGFVCHAKDLFVDARNLANKVRRAAYVSCISRYNRAFIEDRMADKTMMSKIHVRYLGVQLPAGDGARRLNRDTINLCTIARSVEKKGIDAALRLISYLIKQGIPVHYHYIGDGPRFRSLLTLRQGAGLEFQTTFYGALENRQAMAIMETCDLFLLLCSETARGDRDGIPVTLMEAMARGIPVITTPVAGIPELVEDQKDGFIVDRHDHERVAVILRGLQNDPEHYARLAKAARGKIRQQFEFHDNLRKTVELFYSAARR